MLNVSARVESVLYFVLYCAKLALYAAKPTPMWRDADAIGSHLLDSVAMAVQRCTGMALRASVEQEMVRAMGAEAA